PVGHPDRGGDGVGGALREHGVAGDDEIECGHQRFLPSTPARWSVSAAVVVRSPYFIQMSMSATTWEAWIRSATASTTTTGRSPRAAASTAVARTHPLVDRPVRMRLSIRCSATNSSSVVPWNALAAGLS